MGQRKRSTLIFALGVGVGVLVGFLGPWPRTSAQSRIQVQMVPTGQFTAYCFTRGANLS
jgi:hypothetical protein